MTDDQTRHDDDRETTHGTRLPGPFRPLLAGGDLGSRMADMVPAGEPAATWPEDVAAGMTDDQLAASLDSDRLYRDGQDLVERKPQPKTLTGASQAKVAKALADAREELELALSYLETQGIAASADRVRKVLVELAAAQASDDQLLPPRAGT